VFFRIVESFALPEILQLRTLSLLNNFKKFTNKSAIGEKWKSSFSRKSNSSCIFRYSSGEERKSGAKLIGKSDLRTGQMSTGVSVLSP
jgi:hypothetical protein